MESVFIKQLLVSRNEDLNEKVQEGAFAGELNKLSVVDNAKENPPSYCNSRAFKANKEAIQYIETEIKTIFKKKTMLVEQHAKMVIKESLTIVGGEKFIQRQTIYSVFREEIEHKFKLFARELEQLQKSRSSLCDSHPEWLEQRLNQERKRNKELNAIYHYYSGIFEKIQLRHNEDFTNRCAQVDKQSKLSTTFLIQLLTRYFSPSTEVSFEQAQQELKARSQVVQIENEINGYGNGYEEFYPSSIHRQSAELIV